MCYPIIYNKNLWYFELPEVSFLKTKKWSSAAQKWINFPDFTWYTASFPVIIQNPFEHLMKNTRRNSEISLQNKSLKKTDTAR